MARSLAALILAGTLACSKSQGIDVPPEGGWVDLTHDFSAQTIYWPTAKPFELEVVSAQRTPAGYYYAANNFSAAEHGGTHLDAPIHFAEGKWTTDPVGLCLFRRDGTPLAANGPFARMLGYDSAAELQRIGEVLGIFASPEEQSRVLGCVMAGTGSVSNASFRHKNGSRLSLAALASAGIEHQVVTLAIYDHTLQE